MGYRYGYGTAHMLDPTTYKVIPRALLSYLECLCVATKFRALPRVFVLPDSSSLRGTLN
jgi:hypothetical protein